MNCPRPLVSLIRHDFDNRRSPAGRRHLNLVAVPSGSPCGSGLLFFRGHDIGTLVRVTGATTRRDGGGSWTTWHCLLVPAVGACTLTQDEATGAWFGQEDWMSVVITLRRRVPVHCRGGLGYRHYERFVRTAFPALAARLDRASLAMGGGPRILRRTQVDISAERAHARKIARAALEASRLRTGGRSTLSGD